MNKLLKDAIADAKAVRETALANAKLALEEAFAPRMQKMFSEKIKHEMEEEAPVEDESAMEAAMDMENEMMNEPQDEMARMKELAGLNEFDDEDDDDFDMNLDFDEDPSAAKAAASDAAAAGEFSDDDDMGYDDDEEDFSDDDEDLEEIIRQLEEEESEEGEDSDMEEGINTGRIVPGEPANTQFTEAKEEEDDDKEELDEEIDLDEVIAALKEGEDESEDDMNEAMDVAVQLDPTVIMQIIGGALASVGTVAAAKKGLELVAKKGGKAGKVAQGILDMAKGASSYMGEADSMEDETKMEELQEAYSVIEHLREKINEVNLLNAKLLYVNKLFKKHNLTEDQKIRVVETFDRATTVRETKLIFTTLSESFATKATKKTKVMEGFASNPVKKTQILTESNSIVNRFQKLAGLTNNEE